MRPVNSEQGGKAMKGTLFTTNGFNRKKFDHDNFELQQEQLMEIYTESKTQAIIALNPQLELSSPDDLSALRRGKSFRKIDTIRTMKPGVGKQAIDLLKP